MFFNGFWKGHLIFCMFSSYKAFFQLRSDKSVLRFLNCEMFINWENVMVWVPVLGEELIELLIVPLFLLPDRFLSCLLIFQFFSNSSPLGLRGMFVISNHIIGITLLQVVNHLRIWPKCSLFTRVLDITE